MDLLDLWPATITPQWIFVIYLRLQNSPLAVVRLAAGDTELPILYQILKYPATPNPGLGLRSSAIRVKTGRCREWRLSRKQILPGNGGDLARSFQVGPLVGRRLQVDVAPVPDRRDALGWRHVRVR
jgi:hypothetical protein